MKSRAAIRERCWKVYGTTGTWFDKPVSFIRLRKYANGKKHEGPCGWKLRPAKQLAVAMADIARSYRARARHN